MEVEQLTACELRKIFRYEPETGNFYWLVQLANNSPVGRLAGSLNKSNYIMIRIRSRAYYAHRLAWLYVTGEWPISNIDHCDGDPSNNRWKNLRQANQSQNRENARKSSINTTGIKGVHFCKFTGRYVAEIARNRKKIFHQRFDALEEAASARRKEVTRLHGEFARHE
jgi:HNH endonuclease